MSESLVHNLADKLFTSGATPHPGPPRPPKKSTHADRKKKRLGRADSEPLSALHDGELRRAAARAGVEVVQHMAKLWWLIVDQMGVERTAELSAGVAGQRMRKADRSSVVVGEDLGTRDDKVKVSVKKNACSRTDQK